MQKSNNVRSECHANFVTDLGLFHIEWTAFFTALVCAACMAAGAIIWQQALRGLAAGPILYQQGVNRGAVHSGAFSRRSNQPAPLIGAAENFPLSILYDGLKVL